jgi:FAD/FMN-containing dehydrogenase
MSVTRSRALDATRLSEFRAEFRGELVQPGDGHYDAARRVFNGMIDRRPSVIAYCTGVADVAAAVCFARDNDLLVAVRGGGHNVAGNAVCDNGLVIDLSRMKGIRVDPTNRWVEAQAGVTLGELDRETQLFGLATPSGMISTTGIAGLTLGGGVGWLMRQDGLTCDNLLAADLITADGRALTASQTENPELFWGVRGGGGNFGIVTSFRFRLVPVSTVLGGLVFYPIAKAKALLRTYRQLCATASDDLTTIASFATLPADPSLPAELHHQIVFLVGVCHIGATDVAEREVAPFRTMGPPLLDGIGPMSYTALQTMYDASFPAGLQHYWRSAYLDELDDAAIDALVDYAVTVTSPLTGIDLHLMGGAVARVPADATAFGHRGAPWLVNIYAIWTDPSEGERHIEWLRGLSAALRPRSRGVYVHFLADEGETGVRASYDARAYARLVALKDQYDPTNLFRMNQNIKPTVQSG